MAVYIISSSTLFLVVQYSCYCNTLLKMLKMMQIFEYHHFPSLQTLFWLEVDYSHMAYLNLYPCRYMSYHLLDVMQWTVALSLRWL